MAGTVVRDATAFDLLDGTDLSGASTQTGTGVDAQYPGRFAAVLETGTVTGTTPTLDVEIQAGNTAAFDDLVVSLGKFDQVGDEDNETRHLVCETNLRYLRAIAVLGGTTPDYTATTVKVVPQYDRFGITRTA